MTTAQLIAKTFAEPTLEELKPYLPTLRKIMAVEKACDLEPGSFLDYTMSGCGLRLVAGNKDDGGELADYIESAWDGFPRGSEEGAVMRLRMFKLAREWNREGGK